jgi:cytochrome P450
MFSIVPWWRVVRLPKDRRVDRAVKELSAWIGDRVAQTRRSLEIDPTRGERPEHFLEAMVAAKDDAGKSFDDETIFGNAMTMLLAGEDTTAYSIAWAEHLLLDAPAEVAALREEADRVLGGATVPADFDAATRLLYAGAVANESMRLHPVAPVFISEACEDTTVGNIEVPRGTQIALLARAQSIDAKNFAEPLAFRPSRWLSPLGGPHEAGAHQPFGSGPRICPGRSLALLEMKIVLATLHENFDVERVGSARDVREVFSFTMRPSELRVRLTQRPGTRRGVEMPSVVGSFESGPT